jgi:cation transport ATPase
MSAFWGKRASFKRERMIAKAPDSPSRRAGLPGWEIAMHDMNAHGTHGRHEPQGAHVGHAGHDHGRMVADFKKRFWTSLLLTLPVLILSLMIQDALGLGAAWRFSGDTYVLAVLSSAIYFYGGWPFLQGLKDENHRPRSRHDDANRRRHHCRLHLQPRDCAWTSR